MKGRWNSNKNKTGQRVHCSMTLEIGFAIHPRDIVDLVAVYIRAVERVRADPRFANGGGYLEDFWEEFKTAGHA